MPSTHNSEWSDWIWNFQYRKYYRYKNDEDGKLQYQWEGECDISSGHTAATPRSHQTTIYSQSYQHSSSEVEQYSCQSNNAQQYYPTNSPPRSQHAYTPPHTEGDALSSCSFSSSSSPTAMDGNMLHNSTQHYNPMNCRPPSQNPYTNHRTEVDAPSNYIFSSSPPPTWAQTQSCNAVQLQSSYTGRNVAARTQGEVKTQGLGDVIRNPTDRGHRKDQESNDKAGGQCE